MLSLFPVTSARHVHSVLYPNVDVCRVGVPGSSPSRYGFKFLSVHETSAHGCVGSSVDEYSRGYAMMVS